MSIRWLTRKRLFQEVQKEILPVETLLDIGCGIRPQQNIRPLVHICCEPFDQYVKVLKKTIENQKDRTYIVFEASWQDVVKMLPPRSVDTIFLGDVIEHLKKEEGRRLLKASEKIAQTQIIISTPLGFLAQSHDGKKDAWGMSGGHFQEHLSGWDIGDFDETWQLFACKNFFRKDNLGKSLDKPHGKLWAIKNINSKSTTFSEADQIFLGQMRDICLRSNVSTKHLMLSSSNFNTKRSVRIILSFYKLMHFLERSYLKINKILIFKK